MKTFLLSILLVFAASPAAANQEQIEHCQTVGVLAAEVMQMRQAGVPLPEALDAAAGVERQDIYLFLLQIAYRLPIVADDKQVSINAFRDRHILSCLAVMQQPR